MLLVQVVAGDLKGFTEALEVDDLAFTQEAQGGKDFGVIAHVDQVFIGGAGFLFCCTFVSVTCYGKLKYKDYRNIFFVSLASPLIFLIDEMSDA